MYKALIDIGGFKKGEEVPKEKAETWAKMYKESPVEEVSGKVEKSEKLKSVVKKSKPKGNPMADDYLGRNEFVVKKNVARDDLSPALLTQLLDLESKGKKRKGVIRAIKKRMEALS